MKHLLLILFLVCVKPAFSQTFFSPIRLSGSHYHYSTICHKNDFWVEFKGDGVEIEVGMKGVNDPVIFRFYVKNVSGIAEYQTDQQYFAYSMDYRLFPEVLNTEQAMFYILNYSDLSIVVISRRTMKPVMEFWVD